MGGFEEAPSGVGPAEKCGRIACGDTLVAVNEDALAGLNFDAAVAKFAAAEASHAKSGQLLVLKFHKGSLSVKNRQVVEWLHSQRRTVFAGATRTGMSHNEAARQLIQEELKSRSKKQKASTALVETIMCTPISCGYVRAHTLERLDSS